MLNKDPAMGAKAGVLCRQAAAAADHNRPRRPASTAALDVGANGASADCTPLGERP